MKKVSQGAALLILVWLFFQSGLFNLVNDLPLAQSDWAVPAGLLTWIGVGLIWLGLAHGTAKELKDHGATPTEVRENMMLKYLGVIGGLVMVVGSVFFAIHAGTLGLLIQALIFWLACGILGVGLFKWMVSW
jgi:hypothetical protein